MGTGDRVNVDAEIERQQLERNARLNMGAGDRVMNLAPWENVRTVLRRCGMALANEDGIGEFYDLDKLSRTVVDLYHQMYPDTPAADVQAGAEDSPLTGDKVKPYWVPAHRVRDIAGALHMDLPARDGNEYASYSYDELPAAIQEEYAERYYDPLLNITQRTVLTDWQKVTRRGDILGALNLAMKQALKARADVQVDDDTLELSEIHKQIAKNTAAVLDGLEAMEKADVQVDDDVIEPETDAEWNRIAQRNAKLGEPLRKILGHVELGQLLKLNMGAGDQRYKGYVGIDIQETPACDLVHDLEEPLPLPDGCVSHVFCSHTLEHLHMWKVPLVLKDWNRVLANGGILWGYVPDCEAAAALFLETNQRVGTPEDDGTAQWAHQKATEMMLGSTSYDFRRGDEQTHHCAFTHKTLRDVLNAGGFQGVQIDREQAGPWDLRLAFYAVKGVYPEQVLNEPVMARQESGEVAK